MSLNPYLKSRFNNSQYVMLDVILALLPLVFVAWLAYGNLALQQIGISISTALITDAIFSALLLKKRHSYIDGSAVITALLLVFTLSPSTPWYMVVFGSFAAILFGKTAWGGLGKNRFNPALVGREFMAVFFASTLSSSTIWETTDLVETAAFNLFPGLNLPYLSEYLSTAVYKTTGAMGEFSIFAIALGGFYLLIRNRISWHIPITLITTFTLMCWCFGDETLKFSLAGILLGALYMATDMPSSPTNSSGKIYYGFCIGLVAFIFVKGGVRYEYMSYSILLLNGFSPQISLVFKPQVWGETRDWKKSIEAVFMLSLLILSVAFAVLSLYYYDLIPYLIYLYIIYILIKFNYSFSKKTTHVI
ncbi:RnfABCDGE type electron transport complex subunit D [Flavobacterium sp. JP2137]|uniref:RnfABCDGE type electron transport complex subunit D n=1 Tax=Flavobacterium sp. JP2137 TaxID=3414510 RepID=UPI003D2FE7F6